MVLLANIALDRSDFDPEFCEVVGYFVEFVDSSRGQNYVGPPASARA